MARHRRHHRGMFGGIGNSLKKQVSVMDVGVGALAGIVAVGIGRWGVKKLYPDATKPAPDVLTQYAPLLGAAVVGGGLYFLQKKSARGFGHMIGCLLAGVPIVGYPMLATKFPQLAGLGYVVDDYRSLAGMGAYGYLANDTRRRGAMRGLSSPGSLADLAASAMGPDVDDVDMLQGDEY